MALLCLLSHFIVGGGQCRVSAFFLLILLLSHPPRLELKVKLVTAAPRLLSGLSITETKHRYGITHFTLLPSNGTNSLSLCVWLVQQLQRHLIYLSPPLLSLSLSLRPQWLFTTKLSRPMRAAASWHHVPCSCCFTCLGAALVKNLFLFFFPQMWRLTNMTQILSCLAVWCVLNVCYI